MENRTDMSGLGLSSTKNWLKVEVMLTTFSFCSNKLLCKKKQPPGINIVSLYRIHVVHALAPIPYGWSPPRPKPMRNRCLILKDFFTTAWAQLCNRDVRIPKCCIRISPRILTTDPHPRPQADALSDPLSVRESATRFLILTHVYI